jgi:hypothetical protein
VIKHGEKNAEEHTKETKSYKGVWSKLYIEETKLLIWEISNRIYAFIVALKTST